MIKTLILTLGISLILTGCKYEEAGTFHTSSNTHIDELEGNAEYGTHLTFWTGKKGHVMLIINNGYIVDTILSFEFDMDKMKNQDLYDNTIYQVDLKGVKGGSNLKAHLSIEFSPGWFVKNTWINMSVFKLVEDGQWKYVGSYLGDIPTDYRSEVFRLESLQSE